MIYAIASFLVAFLTMPLFIRIARKFNLFDIPDDDRKRHAGMIPYTGGFAFVSAFMLVTGVMMGLEGNALLAAQRPILGTMSVYIAQAGAIIFLLGIVDDFRDLTFTRKFLFQFFAAFFLILGATKSNVFPRVFAVESSTVFVNSIGTTISVFWVVGMTNAVNMIDGMDALAGGTGLIISLSLAFLALLFGNTVLAITLFILAGALVGFLLYNLPPAKVFMGDTGSMFLGFYLGTAGWLLVDSLPLKATSFLVPIVIAGLPVSDTLLAFLRRIVRGQNPFSADTNHIHHVLERRFGLSTSRTVAILLGVDIVLAGTGIAIALLPVIFGWIIFCVLVIAIMMCFHVLGYTRLMLPQNKEAAVPAAPAIDAGAIPAKRNGNGTARPPVSSGFAKHE